MAEALAVLEDSDVAAIGESSTRATDVLARAAKKVARERSTDRGYEKQLADVQTDMRVVAARIAALDRDLEAARRDRSGDEWAQQERVNRVLAQRSDARQHMEGLSAGRRILEDVVTKARRRRLGLRRPPTLSAGSSLG